MNQIRAMSGKKSQVNDVASSAQKAERETPGTPPTLPSAYCCPISMEIMVDPVIVATGHTYDRCSIERWVHTQGHKTCPCTGMKLRHLEFTPNYALKSAIQEWAVANNYKLPEPPAPERVRPELLAQKSEHQMDTLDHPPLLIGHDEIIWAVEVHSNRLFSASADKTIRVWDMESRRCENVLEDHTRPVLSLTISNGRLYSGSYDFSIKVWNLSTLTKHKTLTGHTDAVRALTTAGGRLFSGSYDGTIRVWDETSLACLEVLKGHSGPVRTLVHCSGMIFSGSYDKTVRAWSIQTLECQATLSGHTSAVRALVASHTKVFSGSDDTTIKVWDPTTLTCVRTLEGHEDNVRVLTVGPKHLFSGSWDKTIRVWDIETLECLRVLEGHSEAVLALAVSEESGASSTGGTTRDACLVSGSFDTTVRFWDMTTWRCIRKCEGHADAVRVLVAGPNHIFSGAYDGTIGVWSRVTASRGERSQADLAGASVASPGGGGGGDTPVASPTSPI